MGEEKKNFKCGGIIGHWCDFYQKITTWVDI